MAGTYLRALTQPANGGEPVRPKQLGKVCWYQNRPPLLACATRQAWGVCQDSHTRFSFLLLIITAFNIMSISLFLSHHCSDTDLTVLCCLPPVHSLPGAAILLSLSLLPANRSSSPRSGIFHPPLSFQQGGVYERVFLSIPGRWTFCWTHTLLPTENLSLNLSGRLSLLHGVFLCHHHWAQETAFLSPIFGSSLSLLCHTIQRENHHHSPSATWELTVSEICTAFPIPHCCTAVLLQESYTASRIFLLNAWILSVRPCRVWRKLPRKSQEMRQSFREMVCVSHIEGT